MAFHSWLLSDNNNESSKLQKALEYHLVFFTMKKLSSIGKTKIGRQNFMLSRKSIPKNKVRKTEMLFYILQAYTLSSTFTFTFTSDD